MHLFSSLRLSLRPSRSRVFSWALTCALLAPFAGSAVAQRVNLAKFQTVTASRQGGTYLADFAVDGIVSNFHSHRTGTPAEPFWLEVSYPRPVTVASAHLYSGLPINASPTQVFASFRLQFHNGVDWSDIPGTSFTGNSNPEVAMVFGQPVTATRFRLFSNDTTNPANQRSVRELAFFPPNLVGGVEQGFPLGTDVHLNLAHQRPSSASSASLNNQYGPGYAKNAFDGYIDNTSRWLAASESVGEFLEVDLLANHRIASAHVYSGFIDPAASTRTSTQPITDFVLQYFDTATSAWLAIPGGTVSGNTQSALVVQFSSPVTASKIRLATTTASLGRVQELLVFTTRPGGGSYPLGQDVVDAPPPSVPWDRYSDSFFRLRNGGPDLRLGLVGGSVVHVAADPNFPKRTDWQLLLNHRDGTYRVRNGESGLCLALAEISLADNTPVTAQEYTALPHQDWHLVYVDATRFALVNAYSGLVLQPAGSTWASGASFVVRPAVTGLVIQLWTANLRTHFPKKGIAGTTGLIRTADNAYVTDSDLTYHEDFYHRLGGSWSYGWGRQSGTVFPYLAADFQHAYNPMQWGNFSWDHGSSSGPPENRLRELQASPKPVYYLGFNEPESTSQGYIVPTEAVLRWPRLLSLDAPIVAPVPASIQVNSATNPSTPADGWLNDFTTQADALGYRRDYTAIHWYGSPNSASLISFLENVYEAYGRPVWLTEFSTVDWNNSSSWTDAQNFNFLAEFLWRAESLSWLKRYSLFVFVEGPTTNPNQGAPDPLTAPRSNTIRADGSLTAFGELYAGWDGVASVVNEKAYHLHNKKEYRRIQNPGQPSTAPTDLVASVSPESSAAGNQWILIPGTTANTVRIVSTLDGRRLRYFTGTYVGLVAASNFTGQSEWRLVADTAGWYFLAHPQSGARLRIDASGTLLHGSGSATTDEYKWRFVAPASPDPVGPPPAPASLAALSTTSTISLSWDPVPGALKYTVSRATSSAGPWTVLDSGVVDNNYTDSAAVSGTDYFYQVSATNLLAYTSAPSAAAPGALLPPPTGYEVWLAAELSTVPPADQHPEADPDLDGLQNLLEYALDTAPLVPDSALLHPEVVADRLRISFLRAAPELTYEVLASSDLSTWIVIATNPGTVSSTIPVTVSDSVPFSTDPRRFLRLRVTQP